jgi:hypothetical protein
LRARYPAVARSRAAASVFFRFDLNTDKFEALSLQMLLDPQRILSIGMPPGAVPGRSSKFFDTFDVNDFQLLAWNVENFVAEIEEKTGQSFQIHHHLFVYHQFKELYQEKITPIFGQLYL